MAAFDDLIPSSQARARPGAFDDLLPAQKGKKQAGVFDDLIPEQPSILKMAALENPLAAAIETGANLASQAVALPSAGLAGLAIEAGNVIGFTDKKGADIVHSVGESMTYQPRGEMGKGAVGIVSYPFEKLAELGQFAGGKTLDATDSPVLATAVDTAINALPMAVSPAKKGVASVRERIGGKVDTSPEAIASETLATKTGARATDSALESNSAISTKEVADGQMESGAPGLVRSDPELLQPKAETVQTVRGAGDPGLQGVEGKLSAVSGGHGPGTNGSAVAWALEREGQLRAGELYLDDPRRTGEPARVLPESYLERTGNDGSAGIETSRPAVPLHDSVPAREWDAVRQPDSKAPVSEFAMDHARRAVDANLRMGETLGNRPGDLAQADQGRMAARSRIESATAPVLDLNAGPLSRSAAIARPDLVIKAENAKPVGTFADLVPGSHAAASEPARGFTPIAETQRATQPGTEYSFSPGNSYTSFINDAPQHGASTAPASAAGRGLPIRREDILVPFAKDLGASIYTGRVKGNNVLGFFRRGNEEVRINKHADLETTAHEMGHLLDSRVPAISNEWRSNTALRKELKAISYDQQKVSEGYAEGVRLWMTQPDVLAQRAPLVHEWLTSFATTNKKYGPAMFKAQEGMTKWFGQDAIDRARSKIGDHRPLSDAMNGIFDRFRQSTVDDLHGIYRMERELQRGKLEPVGAYESARLSRASASIADGAVRFGYPVKNADGSFTYRGKGLQDILKPVAERLDDALLYFVGRSANELMMQGREHLFTKGEIRGMVALETPEARKAFAEYQAWNRGVLDFAEAQGVLNPETRARWKRTEYLPFHRIEQPGGLKGKPGDWSGVQALTGGTENIRDVLGNMIGNAAQLIDVAVKNEARVKIANLSSQQGGGKFMVKIDPGSRPVKVAGNQVLDEMAKRYGLTVNGEAPAFFQFLLHNQAPAGSNVVAVLKQGKAVWYEVADPILLRSLESIDRPPMPWLTRWLGMPKRVGQTTITLTPDFMLANIARDTIMGAVMSRSGFRPVLDSINGMRLRMTEDPLYKDYIANGGGLSSLYLDERHLRTKLEKFYSKQGIDYHTVLDTPDKLLNAVETMADAFEMSTRLGEYNRAIKAGEHPRHAAYQGREVSTDFAMRGDSKALGFMYDTVMFLRPAVVSMDRLYRGVAHDPNRAAIGAKTAMLALASVGLYLLNREDPRYQDLPDWDRDANWHFFIGDQHFRYPKIWEIGAVASTAERTVEKLMQSDPAGLGKDFARIIGNTFSLNLMPQFLAPLYEQGANKNSFTKAPIETPGMESVQPFLRAKPSTSETMKALGMASRDLPESLQVNPVRAEALLRGYLNTWGAHGLMLSDRAFFGDKLPEMRADEMPVVRRFYANEPAKHTKFETQFYDMLGEAKRLQGTLRELDRQGRPDIANQKEQSTLAGEAKPLERANKGLQGINAEMKDVSRAVDLTPAEKRQRLDSLTVERNQLLKDAVQAAKAAQAHR